MRDVVPALNVAGIGRVLMWQGGSLWIGRDAGHALPHAHHAIQISVALGESRGEFRLRHGAGDAWSAFPAAIVMPDCRHEFDGRNGAMAQIFVEPETVQGRALMARFAGTDISRLTHEHRALAAGLRRAQGEGDESLVRECRHFVDSLAGAPSPSAAPSPRIAAALAYISRRAEASVTLRDVAAAVHLSPGRLRHLFVQETGATFRGYLLWLRLQRAIAAAMEGRSWTVAAQEAGFADSAHLSRTFRRMYGVAPATLVRE